MEMPKSFLKHMLTFKVSFPLLYLAITRGLRKCSCVLCSLLPTPPPSCLEFGKKILMDAFCVTKRRESVSHRYIVRFWVKNGGFCLLRQPTLAFLAFSYFWILPWVFAPISRWPWRSSTRWNLQRHNKAIRRGEKRCKPRIRLLLVYQTQTIVQSAKG